MLKSLPSTLRAALLVAGALMWAGTVATTAQAGTGQADTGQTKVSQTEATQNGAAAKADTAKADAKLPAVPDYTEGSATAPIHVIEYGAFTCPHCAEFHATVYPKLKKNYIDTGKIKFTFRAFFFNRYGLWADMIARCGGEMRFFGIADMLYDQQTDWVGAGSADKVIAKLKTIGRSAGLTDGQMDQCLKDGPMAQAMVAKFQKESAADKIDGTPTFMINGKKYSNMDYAAFSKVLDGLSKK